MARQALIAQQTATDKHDKEHPMSTDYQLADTPDSTRHYAAIDFPEGSCRTGAESMIVDGATAAEAEAKARDWVAENLRPGARPAITHWGSWADVQR